MNDIEQQKIENKIIKIIMKKLDKIVDEMIIEYEELSEKSKTELREITTECIQEIINRNQK